MDLNGKKLILADGEEFIVIETVEYNNKNYVYMVNKNNGIDAMYGEVNPKDQLTIKSINTAFFKEHILPLFMEKFKNY